MKGLGYSTLAETLPHVDYFVEADSYARHALWGEYHYRPDEPRAPVPWKHISLGFWQTVPGGTTVSFSFAFLYDDKLVCFYYPTSQKIDFDHVETFLEPYWQSKHEGGRQRRCDAMNFHHCIHYCRP